MKPFTINKNEYLKQNIQGFYHTDFGGVDMPNNPNYLYKLKNDPHHNWKQSRLEKAKKQLLNVLLIDLPIILKNVDLEILTVCIVPRAKAEKTYRSNQLLFKATVRNAVNRLDNNLIDGTNLIKRHTDTKTTHLRRSMKGIVNEGPMPYPGISANTCDFSKKIDGRDILLIDDIYTKTVNIDEDMIQELLNCGANSVTFYVIGKTIH